MYAIDRIGLLLTKTRVAQNNDRPIQAVPSVTVVQDTALTQQTGYWESLEQSFRATGDELYLTIGNFSENASTHYYPIQFQPVQQEMLAHSAYYYIDAVSVTPAFSSEEETPVPAFTAITAKVNKTFVLENVNFGFDSYRLDYASREELEILALWLKQNPGVTVILSGHTDDIGGDKYNLTLSRNRAKAVAEYLAGQGISNQRIEYYGYGKSRPLIDQASEAARKINRRVEVKFVQ
jgi:outer membrane protein OmpA-like peptidoglycan-associated protein